MGMAVNAYVLMRPVESLTPGEKLKLYPLLDPSTRTLSISPTAVAVGVVPPVVSGARQLIVAVNPTLVRQQFRRKTR